MGNMVDPIQLGANLLGATPTTTVWWDPINVVDEVVGTGTRYRGANAADPVSGTTNTVTVEGMGQVITLAATLSSYVETGNTVGTFWTLINGVISGSVVEMTANGVLMSFDVSPGDTVAFSVKSDKVGAGSSEHGVDGTIEITNTTTGGGALDSFGFLVHGIYTDPL